MGKLDNGKSGAIFIGFIILLIIFQTVVALTVTNGNAEMWVFAFGSQLVFALSVFIGFLYFKIDVLELSGIKRKVSVATLLFSVLIGVLSLVAFLPLAYLFLRLLNILGYNYIPQYADFTSSGGLFLLGLLGLALFPAIGEELMFRVNMVSGFKGVNRGFAILMSALFFALIHGNASQFVHQFLIGAVMAYIYIITRSIWASAAMHFTNNVIALSISYLEARRDLSALNRILDASTPQSVLLLVATAIIGSIVLIIVLWQFTRYLIKRKEKEEDLPYADATAELRGKYRGKHSEKLGIFASVKTAIAYLDRASGAPIVLSAGSDRVKGGFFGALGLVILIWLGNTLLVLL